MTVINGDRQYGHVKYDVEVRDADHIAFRRRQRSQRNAAGSTGAAAANGAPAVTVFNGEQLRVLVLLTNGAIQSTDVDTDSRASNVHARNATTCSQQLSIDDSLTSGADAVFKCTVRGVGVVNDAKLQQQLLARIAVQAVFDRTAAAYACEVRLIDGAVPLSAVYANVQLELEAALGNGLATDRRLVQVVPAVQVTPTWLVAEHLGEQVITLRGVEAVLQQTEVSQSKRV